MTPTNGFRLTVCGDINIQDRAQPESAFDLVKEHLLADGTMLLGNMEMCLSGADDVLTVKQPRDGETPVEAV